MPVSRVTEKIPALDRATSVCVPVISKRHLQTKRPSTTLANHRSHISMWETIPQGLQVSMDTRSSVLIAGAGPTGLTAALELSRFGVPVRLIDELDAPATTSRAIGVQARTLEEMELRGLASEFVRIGHRAQGGCVYGAGKRIFRLDFTQIDSRYNYLLFISQAETERILRKAISNAGVEVERGVKMIAFAQQATGVSATLQHKDGRLEETCASYLISAEGAHSIVRSSLDLPFEGKTLHESYALSDLHVDGDLPDSDFHIFSSEEGFMGLFPLGGSHFRLIASNPASTPGEDSEPDIEKLQTIYDRRSHIRARLRDLAWSSWFHINSRMVQRLKVGRIFLGGDAAHIHSPAGAQGMNTGIQDMVNLGWKLAFVLHGVAPQELLDTYELERLRVMRTILSRTEVMTRVVGAENPFIRGAFDYLAPWIAGSEVVQANAIAQISQIALSYEESPLSVNYGPGGNLRAGDRAPDLRLRVLLDGAVEQQRLFGILDPSRFTLLFSEGNWVSLHKAVEPWRGCIQIVQTEPEREQHSKQRLGEAPLLLIRPDGYIGFCGGGDSLAELIEFCRRWMLPQAEQLAA